LPFDDLTGDAALAYLGPGLATELCIALGHCPELRVMLSDEQIPFQREAPPAPDFVVRGSVRKNGAEVKTVVQLVAGASGEQLWVDALKAALDDERLLAFQEHAAAAIAAQLAGEHGAIFRTLVARLDGRPASELTSYQAILKGYAYHRQVDEDSYRNAFEALGEAHLRDPQCGLVCTMLAILYFDNLSLEFFDTAKTPLARALHLAREGARLDPDNPLSRLVLARGHLLSDELAAGREEAEAALALDPDSLLYADAIGYMMALLGDWERGERLIRAAIAENPYYRRFARYATWLNALREGDHERALAETEWLDGVGFFWDPLARAATLGLAGREDASRAATGELLNLKPDFPARGRILIRHYVKFQELEDAIAEGLAAGGLVLESGEV
jgi:TolB-like protein